MPKRSFSSQRSDSPLHKRPKVIDLSNDEDVTTPVHSMHDSSANPVPSDEDDIEFVSSTSKPSTSPAQSPTLLAASRRLAKKKAAAQSYVQLHSDSFASPSSSLSSTSLIRSDSSLSIRRSDSISSRRASTSSASTPRIATTTSPFSPDSHSPIRQLSLVTTDADGRKTYFDGTRFYRSRQKGLPITPNDVDLQELIPFNRGLKSLYFSSFGWDDEWFGNAVLNKIPHSDERKVITIVQGCNCKKNRVTRRFEFPTRPDLALDVVNAYVHDRHGSMHSKLWIFECHDFIRIVVGTANLSKTECVDFVWNQCFWAQDFPLKRVSSSPKSTSTFEEDLIYFLKAHDTNPAISTANLRNYDYSAARVSLISSIPGLYNGTSVDLFGHANLHLKLRRGFQQLGAGTELLNTNVFITCSSLGQLSANYIEQFKHSLFVDQLGIVYPTPDVVDSIPRYGRRGAGCLFLNEKQWNARTFPRESFYKYQSHNGYIGHAKMAVSLADVTSKDGGKEIQAWCVMGSHNLSVAAWGRRQRNGFYVRSYELSVLLPPQRYQCSQKEILDRFGVAFRFPPTKLSGREVPYMRCD